jgi:hypothetical protein
MPGRKYTKDEDRIILANMRDVDCSIHREVLRRCTEVSCNYLPDRSPEALREHWYFLIGKRVYVPAREMKLSALLTQREKWRYSRPLYRRSPPRSDQNSKGRAPERAGAQKRADS